MSKQYAVQPSRVRWALAQLQQAGIQAQLQRTPTGYVIVVADDADDDAAPVVGGVDGYQAHGRPAKRRRHAWRRWAAVWGYAVLLLVTGFFLYAGSESGAARAGDNPLFDLRVIDFSDPYLAYLMPIMAVAGLVLLFAVWLGRAQRAILS